MSKKIDMIGKRFGKLTVIEESATRRNAKVYWICKCDCGNIISVRSIDLRNGHTLSCGCLGMSKGEYILKQIFQDNEIPFKT